MRRARRQAAKLGVLIAAITQIAVEADLAGYYADAAREALATIEAAISERTPLLAYFLSVKDAADAGEACGRQSVVT